MKSEIQEVDDTMRELLKVPHSEIKEKLEAERQSKRPTRLRNLPLWAALKQDRR
jgi:hypothetical protein